MCGVRTNCLTALQCIRQNGFVVIVIGIGLFIHLSGQVVHSYFCITRSLSSCGCCSYCNWFSFTLGAHRINCIVYHCQRLTAAITLTTPSSEHSKQGFIAFPMFNLSFRLKARLIKMMDQICHRNFDDPESALKISPKKWEKCHQKLIIVMPGGWLVIFMHGMAHEEHHFCLFHAAIANVHLFSNISAASIACVRARASRTWRYDFVVH